MSRLFVARALSVSGVMAGTVATVVSLAGIVGVIVTAPTFCPESISSARCSAAGSKAALIAAYGLTAAGAAGLLLVAGRAVSTEV